MRKVAIVLSLSLILSISMTFAQKPRVDRGAYVESKNEFMDTIQASADKFSAEPKKEEKKFVMNFTDVSRPQSSTEFKKIWHSPPVSQGISGMCWSFSTTSFYESEIYRLTKREIKLSELYTVYWEYVEKARRFIQERGDSEFGEGSESNAVPRIWKQYGVVPAEAFTGLKPDQRFHDHSRLYNELHDYLNGLKTSNAWNEDEALSTVKSILNHHLGEPPTVIEIQGEKMTPQEYLQKVVRLNLDDYVEFLSTLESPYYEHAEFTVPDNWWHSKEYYNIPLADFMATVKKAVRKGYGVCIGGDVSEPGYESHAGVAMVPTFDIPSEYIDENARQLRFANSTTGDDHGIHLVGYLEKNGKDWYLIKDSGSGSRNGPNPGYYMYHEDYVKLKMLGFTVHRDMVEDILKKCKN